MELFIRGLLVVVCLFFVACRTIETAGGGTVVCAVEVTPGIRVEILDAHTGLPIACKAKATIAEGNYTEVLESVVTGQCENTDILVGAYNRLGMYRIEIEKKGYKKWRLDDVKVTKNVCHANSMTFQAYLEKQG